MSRPNFFSLDRFRRPLPLENKFAQRTRFLTVGVSIFFRNPSIFLMINAFPGSVCTELFKWNIKTVWITGLSDATTTISSS
jgi:hypothetical protein